MGKQYFMLRVLLTIDFVGTVSTLSEGLDSDNSEPIQSSAGTVQAHFERVVSKPVVAFKKAKKSGVNLKSRPYE